MVNSIANAKVSILVRPMSVVLRSMYYGGSPRVPTGFAVKRTLEDYSSSPGLQPTGSKTSALLFLSFYVNNKPRMQTVPVYIILTRRLVT